MYLNLNKQNEIIKKKVKSLFLAAKNIKFHKGTEAVASRKVVVKFSKENTFCFIKLKLEKLFQKG